MFISVEVIENCYERISKLGKLHVYKRKKTIATLKCDNCSAIFQRDLKIISKKRLNNTYFHCCSNCDSKRFAQKKSVDHKRIWDLPSGADIDISKI